MNVKEDYSARAEFIKKIRSITVSDGDLLVVNVNPEVRRHWSDLGEIWLETFEELKQSMGCPNMRILIFFDEQANLTSERMPDFIEKMNELGWYYKDQISELASKPAEA